MLSSVGALWPELANGKRSSRGRTPRVCSLAREAPSPGWSPPAVSPSDWVSLWAGHESHRQNQVVHAFSSGRCEGDMKRVSKDPSCMEDLAGQCLQTMLRVSGRIA
jgi:hypothetical protein